MPTSRGAISSNAQSLNVERKRGEPNTPLSCLVRTFLPPHGANNVFSQQRVSSCDAQSKEYEEGCNPLPNRAYATFSRHIRASDRNGRFAFRSILTLLS